MANLTPYEEEEHILFWDMFHILYPGVFIYHTPNGGYRPKGTGGSLQRQGVVPGILDFFIPRWMLYVEMKRQKGGVVSADQKKVIAQLNDDGYDVIVAKGCNEALADIEAMMSDHWHVIKERAILLPRSKW